MVTWRTTRLYWPTLLIVLINSDRTDQHCDCGCTDQHRDCTDQHFWLYLSTVIVLTNTVVVLTNTMVVLTNTMTVLTNTMIVLTNTTIVLINTMIVLTNTTIVLTNTVMVLDNQSTTLQVMNITSFPKHLKWLQEFLAGCLIRLITRPTLWLYSPTLCHQLVHLLRTTRRRR